MIDFTKDFIDVSAADIKLLIKKAYELSLPLGLGMLHFRSGELDEETVELLVSRPRGPVRGVSRIHMDHIHGRAVKMTIYIKDDKKYIAASWHDHSPTELELLLREIGVK